MKLAFIGIGKVGFALANNLEKSGHQIIIGHDDVNNETVLRAISKNGNFKSDSVQNAIDNSDVVFLATPFKANHEILKPLKFNGKTLIDCTNPVGLGISHSLDSKISGAEMVQKWAPDANVVKAFTIYGFENLIDSSFKKYNVNPVMPIAGNSPQSKNLVIEIGVDLGFKILDTGGLDQALHLEHMTLLWVKMVRRDKHAPYFTWALLER